MESVYVLRISKPRRDGTDKVTHKLVEDPEDAALVVERRQRKADDESYALSKFAGDDAASVTIPGIKYGKPGAE